MAPESVFSLPLPLQFSHFFYHMNQQRFACLKPFTVPFMESMAPWLFVPGTAGIQLEANILEMVQYRATYEMGRIGKKKMYQLYTLMIFYKHRNGVPIAWMISSRNITEDICKWMSTLFRVGSNECSDWHVRSFITNDVATEIEALR
uniref:Uncharacterized protein n=1 Tax=Picea sitchensis TaxID=3332 RepID=D5ADA9_PICSI|nr:unknown [Picea sitchensis]